MSTAIPKVPPRPSRSHGHEGNSSSSVPNKVPQVPPRPIRRLERSTSPQRFARSPLNDAPTLWPQGSLSKSSLYTSESANESNSDLASHSSNVNLPSIGQEGHEYADVFGVENLGASPKETRNIANDLQLHAPKPSLPASNAKQRVSAVTRTDSDQAAAFGIGKAGSDGPSTKSLKTKSSFASQASNGTHDSVPASFESETGIPEIGQRVPMYPNAGDVQAPSPGPSSMPFTAGVGFHNDGSKTPTNGRRKNAADFDVPDEAYGKHGHGVLPHDRFERAYYEKRPDLFKKEVDPYHERAEWAMSSEDLNRIVRDTASRGAGLGTSPHVMSTPSEQVGFQASDEYTSRMVSPRPTSTLHAAHPDDSQPRVDSPLRKESTPEPVAEKNRFESALTKGLKSPSEQALESEAEDEDVIHVDPPKYRSDKIYGSYLQSTESLGKHDDEGGHEPHEEHVCSAPILAEDEVAKEPFGYDLQPAVSPANEHMVTYDETSFYKHRSGSASSLGSAPTSRPGSTPHERWLSSEPKTLENVEEYEPLFPEDDKGRTGKDSKPLTIADRLKRPELQNRKFPSQDIWEDTPNSLQYTATVSTPELPEDGSNDAKPAHENETPEQAFARKQEELAEEESRTPESFLDREKKPWGKNADLMAEARPSMKQRFPSRDIWEDSPASLQLQATVGSAQEEKISLAQLEEQPTADTVTRKQERFAAEGDLSKGEGRATTGVAKQPQPHIPEHPQRARQTPPAISASPPPSKAKPQIPARPTRAKPTTRDSSENLPLTTIASGLSAKSSSSDQGTAAAAKPKPPVPSRPVGSKIAALQGGFMADLNKRLQLGPQAAKQDEKELTPEVEEKEKNPLSDARKGRARGPVRKAPAKTSEPVATTAVDKSTTLGFSTPVTWFNIDPDGDSVLVGSEREEAVPFKDIMTEEAPTPTITTNTAGEDLHAPKELIPETEQKASSPITAKDESPHAEEAHKELLSAEAKEDLSSSTGTLKPETASSENVE